MRRKNSKPSRIIWRGLLLFLPLVWLFMKKSKIMNPQTKMNSINETGLKVFELLKAEGFKEGTAKFITAQAAHETGNFTSKIFKQNNNLFGMKLPKKRKTTATGEKYGHATYESIQDSVKDYSLYYKNMGYMAIYPTIDTFIKALVKRNYFEALETEYKNGLKHFYDLYFIYGT